LKILTASWVGVLAAVSLQPWRPGTAASLAQVHRPFHFVAFALTALLLWRFLEVVDRTFPASRILAARAWLSALVATIVLGGILELLQHAIYRNRMEWWDVRDDALAAIAAILVGHATRAIRTAQQVL
jgi:hypothetical protein